MQAAHSDPRWPLLNKARSAILARLGERGVQRVEFVAAFGTSDEVWVWLATASDAERDALTDSEPFLEEVREALASVGYPADQLVNVHSTAQSQETVDRDYESSWFYALR
jgi:predicted component of type VI protein secretion system